MLKGQQKRRKSFEDCVTVEEAQASTRIGTSLSAPTSYIPMSSLSNHPLGYGREFFISPSSSSTSLFETASKNVTEQIPINLLVEDYSRFLQTNFQNWYKRC